MNRKQYQNQLKNAQQNQDKKHSQKLEEQSTNEPLHLKLWHIFELMLVILLIINCILLGWLIYQNLSVAMIIIIVLMLTLMLFLFCWA